MTMGTSSIRVVHAGDRFSVRIFQSRWNPCAAGTAVNFPNLPLTSSSRKQLEWVRGHRV